MKSAIPADNFGLPYAPDTSVIIVNDYGHDLLRDCLHSLRRQSFRDVDLAFRARLAGHRCRYVSRSKVYHYGNGTAGLASPRVIYLGSHNTECVLFKDMPSAAVSYFAAHVAHVLRSFFRGLGAGNAGAHLKGKLAFLAAVPKVMRKRAKIQRTRIVPLGWLERIMDGRGLSTWLKTLIRTPKWGPHRKPDSPESAGPHVPASSR